MKLIGEIFGIRVFVDKFMEKTWVNIGKREKVIKMNPDVVDKVVELLIKAKEQADDKQ